MTVMNSVRTAIEKRVAEIDITDTNSIVSFGSSAQAELQVISQSMLAGVRNKDVGPAGDSLRDLRKRDTGGSGYAQSLGQNARRGAERAPKTQAFYLGTSGDRDVERIEVPGALEIPQAFQAAVAAGRAAGGARRRSCE